MSHTVSDLVRKKIIEIEEFCGLKLKEVGAPLKKRGQIAFNVELNTTWPCAELYKLESLIKFNILSRAEINGYHKVIIFFKP
jgi:hypothetical protein